MGAHVFVVNEETFRICTQRCVAAVVREMAGGGHHVEKTRADILADLACVRKGDRIFFYEIGKGFHGIYSAHSIPFVDEDEIDATGGKYLFGSEKNPHFKPGSLILPNRILIKPQTIYEEVVDEWRSVSKSAFGRFTSGLDLRSVFYKKVLGRGKSITHLFPEEEAKLASLLYEANHGKTATSMAIPYRPQMPKPVQFDLTPTANGEVKYEKILEGWLIQNLDNPQAGTDRFLGKLDEIEWFGNYVPVSIAGGNLDILVFHRTRDTLERCSVTIVELKKGKISPKDVDQLETYVRWANENLTFFVEQAGEPSIKRRLTIKQVRGAIIGKTVSESALTRLRSHHKKGFTPVVLTYELRPECYRITFADVSYQ